MLGCPVNMGIQVNAPELLRGNVFEGTGYRNKISCIIPFDKLGEFCFVIQDILRIVRNSVIILYIPAIYAQIPLPGNIPDNISRVI